MKENKQLGLTKTNPQEVPILLPIDLSILSIEKQQELSAKYAEQTFDLRNEANLRLMKSKIAESDLAMMTEKVQQLDHDRKIYSVDEKLETGSGNIHVKITGGDTKFITPILIIIGIIILGLAFILSK